MARQTTSEKLIHPTALSEKLAAEEGLFFPPRRLTAMAKRGEIPSLTISDGKVLLIDDAKAREALRTRKR